MTIGTNLSLSSKFWEIFMQTRWLVRCIQCIPYLQKTLILFFRYMTIHNKQIWGFVLYLFDMFHIFPFSTRVNINTWHVVHDVMFFIPASFWSRLTPLGLERLRLRAFPCHPITCERWSYKLYCKCGCPKVPMSLHPFIINPIKWIPS